MKQISPLKLTYLIFSILLLTSVIQVQAELEQNKGTRLKESDPLGLKLASNSDRQLQLDLDDTYYVQPHILDFDDDGILDMVIIADIENVTAKAVYRLENENVVNGWPITLSWDMTDIQIVGKAYIAGNPKLILQYTQMIDNNYKTSFLALNPNGEIEGSYGFSLNSFFPGETESVFFDINKDGLEEFVLIERNGSVRYLDQQGQNMTNWPKYTNDSINFISPVIEDLNEDGLLDILIVTDEGYVYAWNQNGSLVSGFPFQIPLVYAESDEELRETPIVSDLNGDGDLELAIASIFSLLYVVDLSSPNNESWIIETPLPVYSNTQAVGYDIENDGFVEIVQLMSDRVIVYRFNDSIEEVFTYQSGAKFFETPSFVDVNRDNKAEIILVNFLYLTILDQQGEVVRQIPRWTSISDRITPSIYDIDSDGEIEIIHLNLRGVIFITETRDFGFAPWIYKRGTPLNTLNLDEDKDGLWDFEEQILGTEKDNSDTDGDTVTDGLEINQYSLNPLVQDINTDSDGDGLTNIFEVDNYFTDPRDKDTDKDSIDDGDEVNIYGTNPLSPDSDDDGMPDYYEILYETHDPLDSSDAREDPDEDNLRNLDEMSWSTDPEDPDSDDDGLLDGDEVRNYFTDPTTADADADHDDDGLTNVEEVDIYGTDPSLPDSDGDGYLDGEEVTAGSDPLDETSIPTERNNFVHISLIIVAIILATYGFRKKK